MGIFSTFCRWMVTKKIEIFKILNECSLVMTQTSSLAPLTYGAFCQTYGYSGKENVLRFTAKRVGAYQDGLFLPSEELLAILKKEGTLSTPITQPSSLPAHEVDEQHPLSIPLPQGTWSLERLVRQILAALPQKYAIRTRDLPSRGDVERYIASLNNGRIPEEDVYAAPFVDVFAHYWSEELKKLPRLQERHFSEVPEASKLP